MKKLLILFCFISSFCIAQNSMNVKALYSGNTQDTTSIRNTLASLQALYGVANYGGLYWNNVSHKWRIWIGACASCPADSTWVDLPIRTGSISLTTTGTGGLSTLTGNTLNIPNYTRSLTTTGTSGVATLVGNTLNIPNYTTTPAGSNTQIQFNNSGAFGASSNLTWNGSQVSILGTLYGPSSILPSNNFSIKPTNSNTPRTVILSGSDAASGNNNGGDAIMQTGTATGSGVGGSLFFQTGNPSGGGNAQIALHSSSISNLNFTVSSSGASIGQSITMAAGTPTAGVTNGGDFNINGAEGFGGGTGGNINLTNSTTGVLSILSNDLNTGLIINPTNVTLGSTPGSVLVDDTNGISLNQNSTDIVYVVGSSTGKVPVTLSNSATLDFPNTTTGISDLTVTVTGALAGNPCSVSPPNGSVTATATFWCWVSSSNTVTVRFSPKATGGENPASGSFTVYVQQ